MINKYGILNEAKYFSSNGPQNYLLVTFLLKMVRFFHGSQKECQKKVLRPHRQQTKSFIENRPFLYKIMVNLYITYKLDAWSQGLNTNFTLGNCLFGAVKLIKNADPDKYKYGGYDIGYNLCSQLSWTDKNIGKDVIIFEVDNRYFVHTDGRNKNILVLGEEPKQGLDNATITAEAKYPINLAESEKQFLLSLHYNGTNSFFYLLMQ